MIAFYSSISSDDHCLFRGRIHPLYCWLLDRDPKESWKEDLVCELHRMSRFDKSTDAPCDDLLCFFFFFLRLVIF